jgi:hypothetical protein
MRALHAQARQSPRKRQHWQRAAELMLDESAEVDVIARQLHLALLLDCVLDTSRTPAGR